MKIEGRAEALKDVGEMVRQVAEQRPSWLALVRWLKDELGEIGLLADRLEDRIVMLGGEGDDLDDPSGA